MPRLYAVGDRKSGVLFVRTEPFRAVMVDDQAIDSYAKTVGKDYDTVFGEIAGWATGFVADVADGDNWDAKRNFVDAQPAVGLVADIAKGDAWDAKRNFVDTQPAVGLVADIAKGDAWDAKRNFVDTQPAVVTGEADFGLVADIARGDAWDAKRNFVDVQPAVGMPTDADFCFVTDIADGDDWDTKRNFVDIQPIARALDALVPRSGKAFPHPHADLEGFVSRDMA